MIRTSFIISALAVGLLWHYPTSAQERTTLRRECTASRCVYYEGSRRVFSEEREHNTERTIIRDSRGTIRAKVRERDNGTVEVTRTRPGW